MYVKFILPALVEAKAPYWRPIKYALFPPLGLATLAAFLVPEDEAVIVDEHVEEIDLNDQPDLVVIQVYITNAYRAYALADHYRAQGSYVALGGLHVTSLPEEAAQHADSIFLGPGEESFPRFLKEFREHVPQPRYCSLSRTLTGLPPPRRDLIKRHLYLVPNSIVVSRGCPHHCDFCYKDNFFQGGKSFYVQQVDEALHNIAQLPGKHLYFLDDHLLGHRRFSAALFDGMSGMGRLWQAAATVDSVLRDNLIEKAANAGLRSLFIGFETLGVSALCGVNKKHNLNQNYTRAIQRLQDLGIMINASFVFGLDGEEPSVFSRTVEWAIEQGLTTATFHILTPYPGTPLHKRLVAAGRILHQNWDFYDTRHVVYRPLGMDADTLQTGYHWAYQEFYRWSNLFRGSAHHHSISYRLRHLAYSIGWKKLEPFWNLIVSCHQVRMMLPVLEMVLASSRPSHNSSRFTPTSQTENIFESLFN